MNYFLTFIIIAACIFLVYCFIPSWWARNMSSKVLRKGSRSNMQIALTFDDGPSAEYTPQLLNILKGYNIKATFFLVGQRAAQNPWIVKRIQSEGHSIGCHSFYHQHAWLFTPGKTYNDLENASKTISGITGTPIHWYRPPWGTFNLLSMPFAKKLGMKPAYWSIEAQDWDKKTTIEHIYTTVINNAQNGSIIVLHDNGGAKGAPQKTLKALPVIIDTLLQKGYPFVTLDEMMQSANIPTNAAKETDKI